MKLVVQRVTQAAVRIDGNCVGEIDRGLMVLIGVGRGDTNSAIERMVDKLINLRIFADDAGKMNRSLMDVGGSLLQISQFTLYADCTTGRRPAFTGSAAPDQANSLYQSFI